MSPCNGGGYHIAQSYNDGLYREVEVLTRRLCHACRILQKKGLLDSELDEWFYEHDLKDQARAKEAKRRAEQEAAEVRRKRYLKSIRERLLTQLTADEREALGL